MDEEMDSGVDEGVLVEEEVDFDYEYDASRFFDFAKEETAMEVREAEMWFASAESYPPSPFVIKLNLGEILEENASTFAEPKERASVDSTTSHSDTRMSFESFGANKVCKGVKEDVNVNPLTSCLPNAQGLTFSNYFVQDVPNAKSKTTIKAGLTRGSTLMKPTASHLAKQNRPRDRHVSNRFLDRSHKLLCKNNSSDTLSVVEIQASKRQKLEGGQLRKVPCSNQHCNFTHKASKKDDHIECNSMQTRLKLTIPREPDLETAHRAHRMRQKESTLLGESTKLNRPMFRARPLNRKILEAPSLPPPKKSTPRIPEFHVFNLKTSERALQHSSAGSSSLVPDDKSEKASHKIDSSSTAKCDSVDFKRSNVPSSSKKQPNLPDRPKGEECDTKHIFKAHPLNKKIFSSKGDIGIFRNNKRDVTVPMEFNFSTNRRLQYNPPVDLFNKLTLTSEPQQSSESQPKLHHPNVGTKENTIDHFRHDNRATFLVKDRVQRLAGLHSQCGVNRGIGDIESHANMNSRSLGIR